MAWLVVDQLMFQRALQGSQKTLQMLISHSQLQAKHDLILPLLSVFISTQRFINLLFTDISIFATLISLFKKDWLVWSNLSKKKKKVNSNNNKKHYFTIHIRIVSLLLQTRGSLSKDLSGLKCKHQSKFPATITLITITLIRITHSFPSHKFQENKNSHFSPRSYYG